MASASQGKHSRPEGRDRVAKSGLVAKAMDRVLYPQLCPLVALQDEHVMFSLMLADLDFRLFMEGELEIILDPGTRDGYCY